MKYQVAKALYRLKRLKQRGGEICDGLYDEAIINIGLAKEFIQNLPAQKKRKYGSVVAVGIICVIVLFTTVSLSQADNTDIEPALIQSNKDLQPPEQTGSPAMKTQANTQPDTTDSDYQADKQAQSDHRYAIQDKTLEVEAVLVPRDVTVISSSRDGRIINIPVRSGDVFKEDDILVEYDCRALEAEADIAQTEKSLTQDKLSNAYKLFKLEMLSVVDRKTLEVEDKKATARQRLFEARMDDCIIRADFDGRVTNRLANAGEYTRTDRVLLEIASTAPLKADFLIPSTWLRWVNVGAPVAITIQETDETYQAQINRIHGEVDPISQTIQVTAQMEPYDEPLLPGMSGQAIIDVQAVRSAGIQGFLETGRVNP